jgi:MFS family permease
MFSRYRSRSVLGLTMMSAQAFAYNAVFFTYGLVLTNLMHAKANHVGYYIVPFALGNFAGPLVLGPLFDRVGRRVMLTITHAAAGGVLAVTALLFEQQKLSAITLTILWCVVFFFASAAASAAYLTVSEVFPLEIRALAIAFFYAVGTGLGGILGPALFGKLIASKSFAQVAIGFWIAAAWLLIAAVVVWFLAVDAEQKPLEEVADPLSSTQDSGEENGAADEPTGRERREVSGYPVRAGAHWSPRYSFHAADDPLEGQIAALERAAAGADRPLPQRELLARTNARHWGPGVARRAIHAAVRDGRLRREGSGFVSGKTRV